jgi:hypothetical protein
MGRMRAALLLVLLTGCVAPVQWQRVPTEPLRYLYGGAHGVPLAFGGGVCALGERHTHGYPPVPKAAFRLDDTGAAHDERTRYPYKGLHRHHGRTCFREEWHLHLEPPSPELTWDETLKTYVAKGGAPLTPAVPGHPSTSCQRGPCTFEGKHGHAPCAP